MEAERAGQGQRKAGGEGADRNAREGQGSQCRGIQARGIGEEEDENLMEFWENPEHLPFVTHLINIGNLKGLPAGG